MGFGKFLKTLGKIGGIVAAPFTGGASLALTALSTGADIAGNLIDRNAINKGVDAQLGAIETGRTDILNGRDAALGVNKGTVDDIAGANNPYNEAGLEALYSLRGLGKDQVPDFKYDPSQVSIDPSFDFIMSEAVKGLNRSAAGRGRLKSGDTAKELGRYLTGLASKEYAAADARSYRNQSDAYNSMVANRERRIGLLGDLTGVGQRANTETNQARLNNANNATDIYTRSGGDLADLSLQAGNVRASGYSARASNTNSLIDDVVSGVGSYISLRNKRRGALGGDGEDV